MVARAHTLTDRHTPPLSSIFFVSSLFLSFSLCEGTLVFLAMICHQSSSRLYSTLDQQLHKACWKHCWLLSHAVFSSPSSHRTSTRKVLVSRGTESASDQAAPLTGCCLSSRVGWVVGRNSLVVDKESIQRPEECLLRTHSKRALSILFSSSYVYSYMYA